MDENEKPHPFLDWLEGNAGGRAVLAVRAWLRRVYYLHLDRYHLWNAKYYRFCAWLAATVLVLLALAALAGTFRFYYRHYREKQGQQAAQTFLARGDYRNASLCARQVLALNPRNAPACRVMAELADRAHSPQTLEWLQRLVRDEPTLENKLILASAGLNYQPSPFSLTAGILQELAPTASNRASYQVVAASLAMHNYHLAEAEAHYEAAAGLEPTNELFRLSAAIVRMAATNPADQGESRATLEKLTADDRLGLLVLRALVADRLFHEDAAAASIYSRQLVANGHATLADQLQQLGILQRLKSPELNQRLQTVQQQVATNTAAIAELSAWMQGHGLTAENLDWLTGLPIRMMEQRPVQIALAQGYLQSGRWKELRDLATQGNWGDLEFFRFALVFRAWSELGVAGEAAGSWNAAMAEAAGRREAMNQLLQLAETWQLKQERVDLLLQMVLASPGDQALLQALESLDFNSGNTRGLHELYAGLHAKFPADTAYKNDLAATDLLLKTDLPKAFQLASEAYAENPTNANEASTYAFALHVKGWDKQGLAVLQQLPPAKLAEPSVALYYGVLLAAAGKADAARPWLEIARTKGHLLPEEQALLSAALDAGARR